VSGLISIAVTPNAPSAPKGLTQQFTATGTFSDTSTADLTSSVSWTSGTPASATINGSSGLANALAAGGTLITATSGSVSGSTTLTVTPAIVESIVITPNPAETGILASTQLTATGTYSDGTTANVTSTANWISGTPTVATVGPTTGLTTGVSLGSTTISAAVGSVTGTAPLSVVTSAWVSTGSMTTAREGHTATMLPNGKVLVAGGSDNAGNNFASAEVYDPVAGTWTPTGSLTTARIGHTATLLPNGKVLVAGGGGFAAAMPLLASAEIYDPVAGTWALTGSLATARGGHTATLLPNGTVLVAGGDFEAATSAEIYDPVAGTWTPTGSLTTAAPGGHTATLLPNGTVLVAGGGAATPSLASAEIYDPAAGTWSPTGDLTTVRSYHTATLLPNGLVLVAGGYGANYGQNGAYVGDLASAELYDPAAGTWTATGNLTTSFVNQTATLLPNGTVLIAGGAISVPTQFLLLADANLYDPVTGTWAPAASFPIARDDHTATLLPNGTVLVAGGLVSSSTSFVSPPYLVSASALIYY
jgi:Bacterial Ig-like domain (group 2)/Galactose oxidase, central domain/Kelch motif